MKAALYLRFTWNGCPVYSRAYSRKAPEPAHAPRPCRDYPTPMPANKGRSVERYPCAVCDACGGFCFERHLIECRCFRCFAGVFVNATAFYFMEIEGDRYAIPRPEIDAAPEACFTVNVSDPDPAVLRERIDRWERRFEVG